MAFVEDLDGVRVLVLVALLTLLLLLLLRVGNLHRPMLLPGEKGDVTVEDVARCLPLVVLLLADVA